MTTPAELSRELGTGRDGHLGERRAIVAGALAGALSMAVIGTYQVGLTRRLPEPPLPGLDAERVDANPSAYAKLQTPDGSWALRATA